MKNKLQLAPLLLVLPFILEREPIARASASDFQYSFVNARATCQPQYGQTTTTFVVSEVYTFCPYGPQVDAIAQSQSAMQQAAQASCPLGKVTVTGASAYPFSSRQAADSARMNICSKGCTQIAWTYSSYSPYNNPTNCHP